MPSINIQNFTIDVLNDSQIRINVQFGISQTSTESQLNVPGKVWFQLMEWDGSRFDPQYLSSQIGNDYRILDDDDEVASGWQYAGLFTSGTHNYSFVVSRSDLPGESGNEEWYVVGECRAEIHDSVAFSNHIPLNLA